MNLKIEINQLNKKKVGWLARNFGGREETPKFPCSLVIHKV